MKIKQLQQPTGNTCVCTAIAMATGHDLDELVEKYHVDYFSNKIDEFDILKSIGAYFVRQGDDKVVRGRVYLASVPSLSTSGKTHQIVIDAQNDEIVIWDPAKGKVDKKYYVWDCPEGDSEIELGGWNLNAEIIYYKEN